MAKQKMNVEQIREKLWQHLRDNSSDLTNEQFEYASRYLNAKDPDLLHQECLEIYESSDSPEEHQKKFQGLVAKIFDPVHLQNKE